MKICPYLLVLGVFLGATGTGADAFDSGRYALPPSKIYFESCNRDVQILHPGFIEVQRELHSGENFWMIFEISTHDGSKWGVLCDLVSGKIIRDELEFSDGFQRKTDPVQQQE